jgi:formylglycine-generating enzyme required for sulfatase activity
MKINYFSTLSKQLLCAWIALILLLMAMLWYMNRLENSLTASHQEIQAMKPYRDVPHLSSEQAKSYLPLITVPKMANPEPVPTYLYPWLGSNEEEIVNDHDFQMMSREVTIGEFSYYFEQLTQEQKENLGENWRIDEIGRLFPQTWPVSFLPWWAVSGYAAWMSDLTGYQLDLPTKQEWKAALWYNNQLRKMSSTEKKEIKNLLSGPWEWMKDTCPLGHIVMGVKGQTTNLQWTDPSRCDTTPVRALGFRLVRHLQGKTK